MYFDIRYADDTTCISVVFEKLKLSTLACEKSYQKWGLNINPLNCAIMTSDSNSEIEIDNNVKFEEPKFPSSNFLFQTAPQMFNTEY